jgi:hypothetical protein
VTHLAILVVVLWSSTVNAQQPQPVGLTIGGLISHQPEGYHSEAAPYLDNGLGGVVPGVSAGVALTSSTGPQLTIEISSTKSMEAWQSGRFVSGSRPAPPQLAVRRDTLLSFLPGFRLRLSPRGAAVEPKGGASLMWGTVRRGTESHDTGVGRFALTAGFDGCLPISQRVALIPTFRYSYAFRGDDAMYLGLGPDILRVGIGVRFGLGSN